MSFHITCDITTGPQGLYQDNAPCVEVHAIQARALRPHLAEGGLGQFMRHQREADDVGRSIRQAGSRDVGKTELATRIRPNG